MILVFTQGQKVTGKLEHGTQSVEMLYEVTQIFMMVDYVRVMNVKKSSMANMDRLSICSSCYIEAFEVTVRT